MDRCIRRHSPINLECSMTLGRKQSYANKQGEFYSALYFKKFGRPVPLKFELLDVEGFPYCQLTLETYRVST